MGTSRKDLREVGRMSLLNQLRYLKGLVDECEEKQKQYIKHANYINYKYSNEYIENKVRKDMDNYKENYDFYVYAYRNKVIYEEKLLLTARDMYYNNRRVNSQETEYKEKLNWIISISMALLILLIPLFIKFTFWRLILFGIIGIVSLFILGNTNCFGVSKIIAKIKIKNLEKHMAKEIIEFHEIREKLYKKYLIEQKNHAEQNYKKDLETEKRLYSSYLEVKSEIKSCNSLVIKYPEIKLGYLDSVINKIYGGVADSVKEALQLIDRDIANNKLRKIIQSELEKQTKAIENIKINVKNEYTYNTTFNYEETTKLTVNVH